MIDSEGIVHHEYAPDGQTINKEFYLEVLRHLCELVRRKRPEKWRDGDWILHHDNAPAHTSHFFYIYIYLSMLHYLCNTTCYSYLHYTSCTLYTYVILFVC